MPTQAEKGEIFHALHQRKQAFIIPNPWDIGTARLLAHLGFEALATTSMGYAFSVGQRDMTLNREQTLAYAAAIVSATDLPVSADLEKGFGDTPEIVAETIRLAAGTGLAGGSIEDSTGRLDDDSPIYELGLATERIRAAVAAARALPFRFTLTARAEKAYAAAIVSATDLPVSADLEKGFGDTPEIVAETIRLAAGTGLAGGSIEDSTGRLDDDNPIYELGLATERISAAVAAARALPFRFTLTARAENYLWGRPDLGDTIKRLQAYQEAGADVLYAPGLTTRDDIATVVRSVDRPVNVVMGLQGVQLSLADLSAIGVRRVSVGSALNRVALGAFLRAAREMHEHGTFTFAKEAASPREISGMLKTFEI